MVLLAASRTNNAAELPLAQAETAEQPSPRAVPLRAKYAEARFAIAERALRMRVTLKL